MSGLSWSSRLGLPASWAEPDPNSSQPPAFCRQAPCAAAFLLCLLLLGPPAWAQTPSLALDPTEIPAASLDGATITLVPKNATFLAAGTGDAGAPAKNVIHPDDYDSNTQRIRSQQGNGEARLNAAGLAKITLSGEPSGLTIASATLLAREHPHSHGGALNGHRSVRITLAYSGPAIAVDDAVTVTVAGGSRANLLRFGRESFLSFPPNLSADFTIKAAGGGTTTPPSGGGPGFIPVPADPPGPPSVTRVWVASDPGPDGRYRAGEAIEVWVRFSEGVHADRDAALALDVGGARRRARLVEKGGPAGDRLLFRYVVGPEDRDADGFGVPADALAANGRAIRERFSSRRLDPDLGGHALSSAPGHPVGPAQVPLLPPASDPGRKGFVRIINHSERAGEVAVHARDDAGPDRGPVTLHVPARGAVHFSAADLESGSPAKGIAEGTGPGMGNWRLELSSGADIEALAYVRHDDGFLSAVHDVAPREGGGRRLATFNPGGNFNQASRVYLAHRGAEALEVRVAGTDDAGGQGGAASVEVPPGGAAERTAAELEAEGLDAGSGKWRLRAVADAPFTLMGLMEGPSGHLSNLSSPPLRPEEGKVVVPLLLSAADPWGRQGILRVASRSEEDGAVAIRMRDDSGIEREPLTLALGAGRAVQLSAHDLEAGNPAKGLEGSTGPAHTGHWWLALSSDLDFEASALVRHPDGLLTAMHGSAPLWGGAHEVATFNPASNDRQASRLRLLNAGPQAVRVRISGVDDAGAPSAGTVSLTVPPRRTATLGAAALEAGGDGLEGALGDGDGKWRLTVEPEGGAPGLRVMSLVEGPLGQLANLSSRTATRE